MTGIVTRKYFLAREVLNHAFNILFGWLCPMGLIQSTTTE